MPGWDTAIDRMDRIAGKVLGGEPVIVTPRGGSPKTVTGIFDRASVFVDEGTAGVDSVGPAVFFRLGDLPVDPDADPTYVIRGLTYRGRKGRGDKRDGQGGIWISLLRVGA